MLEVAVKWDYWNFNPNTKIEKNKRARLNASCYSKEDMLKLLQYLVQKPLKCQAIITALDLTCRRGELTGLSWDDIDFKTGKVTINKATQYIDRKIFEKETKSVNSDRINFLNPSTIKILQKYKKEQQENKWNLVRNGYKQIESLQQNLVEIFILILQLKCFKKL